ncbi:hypothetical protein D4764_04G0014060 [Takifugu flavidus]|uniref:Uncharacterized protein n=1 Tax=Takifugu flavidus TaxID=433684 RepID=A0A5C6N7A7_9TELE|nr:hypothetical protein D4764_04G0014060 [Takifugu flavidus]
MHWVQQGVLYLPREEGGQGLIHLASRTAAFRMQFMQRFLTGPENLMWRDVARCVFRREPTVHGARLDVSAEATPRLTAALWRTQTLLLQHAAEGVLRLWRNRLSTRERHILEDYGQGTEPDSLVAVDKKTLYNDCVRVLNRRGLSNRSTSVWADRLEGDGTRPCWRVLYKPPLKKRTGDLQ